MCGCERVSATAVASTSQPLNFSTKTQLLLNKLRLGFHQAVLVVSSQNVHAAFEFGSIQVHVVLATGTDGVYLLSQGVEYVIAVQIFAIFDDQLGAYRVRVNF